jgi:hypothetical protein
VRSNDGGAEQNRLQNITRMANDALRSAGIDPTPGSGIDAMQAARFHRALQDELSVFESRGRKPTEAEAYDIVKGLKDTGIKSGWLEVTDHPASPTVLSDFSSTDDAFHKGGGFLAHAGPTEQPEQRQRSWLTLDFDRLRRMREEDEQRAIDERAAAGTGGAPGAPATEPDPGSPEYQAADAQARATVAEQEAEGTGGQGGPQSEPLPGSPEYLTAEAEARKLDENVWENLGFLGQLRAAFKRFNEENKTRGATFNADSAARRLETVLELQRRRDKGEKLEVAEKQYLLRNRNVAQDLAGAVERLIDAQRHIDELPASEPLRQLFEAKTVGDAGRLLREHPGEIARAIGVESLPSLTVSLIAMAALGPVGGAITLTGTSGLDGYAKGLVGALARAGVDISNADDLTSALQDKELMERIRRDATTDGAIEAGITAAAMMIGIRRSLRAKNKQDPELYQRRVEQFDANKRNGRAFEQEQYALRRQQGYTVGEQVTLVTPSGSRGRTDALLRKGARGKAKIDEYKSSPDAAFSRKQKAFLEDVSKNGATIAGDGKPGFEGGQKLPPTPYKLVRHKPKASK